MNRKSSYTLLALMLLCLLAILLAGTRGPIKTYVQAVKLQMVSAEALGQDNSNDQLMIWIKAEAPKHNELPVDAVIDRIWKAIPGYNGREVDVEATYSKAKALGLTTGGEHGFPWVYRVLKPKVDLKDLPLQPIYRGNPAKPMVALMINVAWGDEFLPPMLATLKAANVKATFFFDGKWLSKNSEMAQSIIKQGHEVSNHAYSHPNMSQLGMTRQREEIGKTEALLKKLGASNVWFAPPSGDYNSNTVKVASEFGLRTVLWTLDTVDWQKPQSWTIVDKVSRKVGPGTMILMHPTAASQGALKGMIKAIKAKGYVLGTVSETLSPERIEERL
ncbi:polysaccharide deacetylase family protein [Cohnella abietis]|uniref:Chitooligosaccharide deacetylase n=1 Tax=Cohnella abietis TaxID=2507935 RepID=A0A3T1D8K1_9BACL|nr:polysaccharide deacetylase family protein [Cohnella abietis]BBI34385.1 chitooligosaccharide deacetylase [Cohnella abietis]